MNEPHREELYREDRPSLRALVTERHAAFAQEMLALFEQSVAQLEDEVRRLRAENERQRQILRQTRKRREETRNRGDEKRRRRAHRKKTVQQEEIPKSDVEIEEKVESGAEGLTENSSDSESERGRDRGQALQQKQAPEPEPPSVAETEEEPPTEHSSESEQENHDTRRQEPKTPPKPSTPPKERKFSCSICGKTFCHKSILKRHMSSHQEDRRFECSECGTVFGNKHHLERHKEIHRRKRPSRCESDVVMLSTDDSNAEAKDMTSPSRSEEERDGRSVENADVSEEEKKGYPCLHCNRVLSSISNRNKHIRMIHQNRFSFKSQMQKTLQHRHTHLSCSKCDQRFRFKSELDRHMTRAHRVEKETPEKLERQRTVVERERRKDGALIRTTRRRSLTSATSA
ncbi:hypothetical protein WMY93_026371 [Mugilogobius chulae]|uniref:C2H2-type domain-containing protein n=1 Tax=Mugilogobius chulae TaxID=88201 RepID=A0AAW0N304_9GOBI